MRGLKITGAGFTRFAGSQADMRIQRQNLVDLSGAKKSDFSVEEVDIPTGKGPLLDFVNSIAQAADPD